MTFGNILRIRLYYGCKDIFKSFFPNEHVCINLHKILRSSMPNGIDHIIRQLSIHNNVFLFHDRNIAARYELINSGMLMNFN